jgi:hypothetical protein
LKNESLWFATQDAFLSRFRMLSAFVAYRSYVLSLTKGVRNRQMSTEPGYIITGLAVAKGIDGGSHG